jgi:hypothetical protein
MIGSMNRPGDESNIPYPFNIQRQKLIEHRGFIKIIHHPSTCLSNTIIFSGIKDVDGRYILIREKSIHTNNHLYTPPAKTWSSTTPVMVPRSNRRIKMRKLCKTLIPYLIETDAFTLRIILISTIVGSIGGLNQTSIRKILTYSSMNHTG